MEAVSETKTLEASYRKSLGSLDMRRKALELESQALFLELTTPPEEDIPPMGIDSPLVDADGYPRGDIDIYRARTLRQRFQIIQTDHKELMKQTEHLLVQLAALKNPQKVEEEKQEYSKRAAPKPKPRFDPITGKWVVMNWDGSIAGVPNGNQRNFDTLAEGPPPVSSIISDLSETSGPNNAASPSASVFVSVPSHLKPFARVDAIAAASPAHTSGLREEDLVVEFGYLNMENHNHLKAIADLVPDVAAEKRSISLTVRRKRPPKNANGHVHGEVQGQRQDEWETLKLSLTPKPWPGRGLIGCHLVPYTE